MREGVEKRELTFAEILSTSWGIYKSQFKTILVIIVMIYLPINIILSFIPLDSPIQEPGLRGFRLYLRVSQVLEALIGVVATMAVAFVVERALKMQGITYREAFAKSISRWVPAVSTNIIGGLIILGLAFLLIVPGIIWAIFYTFSTYVVALKNLEGKEALRYSKAVVKRHWWKIFGIVLFSLILEMVLAVVLGLISGFLPDLQILSIITDTLLSILFAFFTVVEIILFLNLDYCMNAKTRDVSLVTSEVNNTMSSGI